MAGGKVRDPHNAHESPEGPSETAPPFRFNRYCLRALQPNLGMLPTESSDPNPRYSLVLHTGIPLATVGPSGWAARCLRASPLEIAHEGESEARGLRFAKWLYHAS